MPIATSYQAGSRLLSIVGEGTVTMEEREESFRQMIENPNYSDQADILANVSGITNPPTNFKDVSNLIQLLMSRFSGRIAIVNTHVGHVTLSHFIVLSADQTEELIRVFSSEVAARVWLES